MPIWSGAKDRGTRSYEPTERERVEAILARLSGEGQARSIDQIGQETGLESRTVRAILSAVDGEPVLAYTDDQRVYVAEWQEEGEGYSQKLESQIRTMRERLARRATGISKLPRRQARLF